MKEFLKRRKWWLLIAFAAIVGVVFWALRNQAAAQSSSQFQTETIKRGSLVATIGATGSVRAKQSAVLVWQAAGTVDVINAKVGDNVPANFTLAYLQKTSLPQSIILAEADLSNAKQALDTLLNSDAALAQAAQTVANAKQALEDAQKNVTKLDYRRASDDLLEQTRAELALANKQISMAEDAYKMVKNRPDGDPLKAQALLNLVNARLERDRKQATLDWYLGKPSELDAEKYRAALALAEAQLADAQREYERLAGGNAAEIAVAQARVDAAQATLNLARLVSPFAATVTEALPLPGDQVGAGASAFRLDDLSSLLVDVEVSEVDINSVTVGQAATLSFDAILDRVYHGSVVQVAQVGADAGGVVNFRVTVELMDADHFVKPGMTAAVNIVVKELDDALLVPNRAVRLVDGERVVYLLRDGLPARTKIALGASGDTVSAIVGGDAQAGDVVILNPPVEFLGPGGGFGFGN